LQTAQAAAPQVPLQTAQAAAKATPAKRAARRR
jgi:hypothetical protein